jgi:hypothetical protein
MEGLRVSNTGAQTIAMVPMAYRDKNSVPLESLSTLVLRIWDAQAICRKEWKRYSLSAKTKGPQAASVASP